jgi:hypothetical protein
MRRNLVLFVVCLCLGVALVGCTTPSPIKECVLFRSQEICTGDSAQEVLHRLGEPPVGGYLAQLTYVASLVEEPVDIGWTRKAEFVFVGGKLRRIVLQRIEYLP